MSSLSITVKTIVGDLFEKKEFTSFIRSNLEATIDKIKTFVSAHAECQEEGVAYIQQINAFIKHYGEYLAKKRAENPLFSAIWCVRTKDFAGLQYLVWNCEDVNQKDRLERTALDLALNGSQELKIFAETLLCHPHIIASKIRLDHTASALSDEKSTATPSLIT